MARHPEPAWDVVSMQSGLTQPKGDSIRCWPDTKGREVGAAYPGRKECFITDIVWNCRHTMIMKPGFLLILLLFLSSL